MRLITNVYIKYCDYKTSKYGKTRMNMKVVKYLGFISFMLVTILCEGTMALWASIDLGKGLGE